MRSKGIAEMPLDKILSDVDDAEIATGGVLQRSRLQPGDLVSCAGNICSVVTVVSISGNAVMAQLLWPEGKLSTEWFYSIIRLEK